MLRLGCTEHWSPRNRISRNRDKGSPPPPGTQNVDPFLAFFGRFAVLKKWSRDYRTPQVWPSKCRLCAGTMDFSPLKHFCAGGFAKFLGIFPKRDVTKFFVNRHFATNVFYALYTKGKIVAKNWGVKKFLSRSKFFGLRIISENFQKLF
jgi:hypothetical protein